MPQQVYISITLALLFGLYATYIDQKTRKIPNLCTLGLLWAGLASQAIFLISGLTTLESFALIFTVSTALSFGAYWLGVFAPGDAKLYWGMTLILPASFFEAQVGRFTFPPVVLLLNILFPYFCWAIFQTLLFTSFSEKKQALFSIFSSKDIAQQLLERGQSLLQFFAIAFYVSFLLSQLQIQLNIFLTFVLIIALHISIRFFAKRQGIHPSWQTLLVVLPSVLIFSMFPGSLFLLGARLIVPFIVFLCVLPLILGIFLNLDNLRFSKPVDVSQLQPGMIPAERIVQTQVEDSVSYTKEPALYANWHSDHVIVTPASEGLSQEKIDQLQTLAKQGHFEHFENQIVVQQSSHFALFVLLGFLLTILLKGPFYQILF